MANSRLCDVCYRAALRGVDPQQIRDEDRRYRESAEAIQRERDREARG